jgi:hypothetical protein
VLVVDDGVLRPPLDEPNVVALLISSCITDCDCKLVLGAIVVDPALGSSLGFERPLLDLRFGGTLRFKMSAIFIWPGLCERLASFWGSLLKFNSSL